MHINSNLEVISEREYTQVLEQTQTVFYIRAETEVKQDTLVYLTFDPPILSGDILIDGVAYGPVSEGTYELNFPEGAWESSVTIPFASDEIDYEMFLEIVGQGDPELVEPLSEPDPELDPEPTYDLPTLVVVKENPHLTVNHPASIFTRWSREEKAAIGIYEVEQKPVPEGMQAIDWTYEIVGDHAVGTPTLEEITEPSPYVPHVVSRAQAMYVMTAQGIWDQAVAFVDAIEDPMEKALAKIALYETQEYTRDSPFLALASDALGLSEEDIDNLFVAAHQVKL